MPGFPATEIVYGDKVFFKPDEQSTHYDVQWLVVLSPDDWQACQCSWASPLHGAVQGKSVQHAFLAEARRPTESILKVAARCCFHKLPQMPITQLLKFTGISIQPGASFFQMLEALISGVLDCSLEELFEIMRLRTVSDAADTIKLFEECDLNGMYADDPDAKDVEQFTKTLKSTEEGLADYKKDLAIMSSKINKVGSHASSNRPANKAKTAATPIPNSGWPHILPYCRSGQSMDSRGVQLAQ